MILNSVRQRIRDADVLIMDIGNSQNDGFNPNVLIEVGMALGFSHHLDQALFILKPQGQILPSDLHGFLVTDYSFEGSEFRLVDSQGFHAALRSTVQRIAEERLMIGRPKEDIVSVEGDDVTDPTP